MRSSEFTLLYSTLYSYSYVTTSSVATAIGRRGKLSRVKEADEESMEINDGDTEQEDAEEQDASWTESGSEVSFARGTRSSRRREVPLEKKIVQRKAARSARNIALERLRSDEMSASDAGSDSIQYVV